jgi:hypothetical protein
VTSGGRRTSAAASTADRIQAPRRDREGPFTELSRGGAKRAAGPEALSRESPHGISLARQPPLEGARSPSLGRAALLRLQGGALPPFGSHILR